MLYYKQLIRIFLIGIRIKVRAKPYWLIPVERFAVSQLLNAEGMVHYWTILKFFITVELEMAVLGRHDHAEIA